MKKIYICFILVFLLCACGKMMDENQVIQQENQSLTLSLPEPLINIYSSIISEYKRLYPEVEVSLISYPYDEVESVKNTRKKMAADVMAGNGYDLYIEADIEFDDLFKVVEAGAFEDLNPYFENDAGIDKDEYLDCVFNLNEDKSKCYLLPYGISVNFLATNEKVLNDADVDLENCKNYEEQIMCMEKYHTKYPERNVTVPNGGNYSSLESMGFTPWKSEKNEMILQSSLLRKIEGLVKEENAYEIDELEKTMDAREDFIKENKNFCMMIYNHPDFETICKLGGSQSGIIVPQLLDNGNTKASTISHTVAIASGSVNKKNAWNFIKLLLGDEYQKELSVSVLPVKKSVIENWFSEQEQIYVKENVLIDGESYPGISKEQFQTIKNAIYQSEIHMPLGYNVMEKYYECMEPYYKGKETIESCIREFYEYLEIYYSE